jgi:hypothetical protein
MATKILREEIVKVIGGTEQFEAETWGELKFMPRNAQSVFAIFGMFERTSHGTLLYTLGSEEMDIDSLDSHYLDDLRALREGRVEIVY